MVTTTSTVFRPPAGSTREGWGPKSVGSPLWHAAAASRASRAQVSLEELKVVPEEQRDGAGATAQVGKGRIAVDGPAHLGERDGVHEAVLDAEREQRARNEGALGDAGLAAELHAARDHLQRWAGARPQRRASGETLAPGELRGEAEEVVAGLRRSERAHRLPLRDEGPGRLDLHGELGAEAAAAYLCGEDSDGRSEPGEVARRADRGAQGEAGDLRHEREPLLRGDSGPAHLHQRLVAVPPGRSPIRGEIGAVRQRLDAGDAAFLGPGLGLVA